MKDEQKQEQYSEQPYEGSPLQAFDKVRKENYELQEKNKELELKVDRLESACNAYNYSQRTYQEEIKELKKQIEELKTSLQDMLFIYDDRSFNKLDCDWKVNAIKRAGELARYENKIKPEGCIIGKDEFGKDFIAHCGCADCINRSEALLDLRKGYLEKVNKITELEAQIEIMKCCGNDIIKALKESNDYEWLHAHNGKAKYVYLQTVIDIVNEKFEEIKEK